VILLKPHQPAHTEGCSIQHNATCVTGHCLAHALLRASVRVTTQQSAVVTRSHSGLKYAACQNFLKACPTAPGIMASFDKYFFNIVNDNDERLVYTRHTQSVLSVATTAKWQPRHLRVVQQVHQRKLRSFLNLGQRRKVCPSSKKERPTCLFYPAGVCLLSTHELCARRLPIAVVLPCSFSTTAGSPCLLQRRC